MVASTITYDVVDTSEAQTIIAEAPTSNREWARLLEQGKMLRMSRRPQWTKSDTERTGMRLKTKAVNKGDKDAGQYVWLVARTDDTASETDGQYPEGSPLNP